MAGLNKADENGKSIDYIGALFYHEKDVAMDGDFLEFKEEIIKINNSLRSKEEKSCRKNNECYERKNKSI
ncbi:hypothetical protein FC680_20255 [Bacillus cereus]|uniref:hypothetical protein n=1 Tax=Bacillus cereus TaxID=1396 RepID=UPI0011334735|nr:hypothetical protein [Bacillus cereus]TKH55745.1 hypothetical protein FC680_20255 [Bacillus cereus]